MLKKLKSLFAERGRGHGPPAPPAPTALLRFSGAILHTKIRGWVTVARALEMATELFTAVEIPTMELALYLAKASMSTAKKMKIAESRAE